MAVNVRKKPADLEPVLSVTPIKGLKRPHRTTALINYLVLQRQSSEDRRLNGSGLSRSHPQFLCPCQPRGATKFVANKKWPSIFDRRPRIHFVGLLQAPAPEETASRTRSDGRLDEPRVSSSPRASSVPPSSAGQAAVDSIFAKSLKVPQRPRVINGCRRVLA